MAAYLERRGVKVERVYSPAPAPAIQPGLPPIFIGPCYEVMDLYDAVGVQLNSKAKLTAPAKLKGNIVYDGSDLNGLTLKLKANNGSVQTVIFPAGTTSQSYIESYVNARISGITLEFVDDYVNLRTVSTGDSAAIEVGDGTVNTKFGLESGAKVVGGNKYKQFMHIINFGAFPVDKASGTDMLNFDTLADQIRAFYVQGGGPKEMRQDRSCLRNRKQVVFGEAADPVNLDNLLDHYLYTVTDDTDTITPKLRTGKKASLSIVDGSDDPLIDVVAHDKKFGKQGNDYQIEIIEGAPAGATYAASKITIKVTAGNYENATIIMGWLNALTDGVDEIVDATLATGAVGAGLPKLLAATNLAGGLDCIDFGDAGVATTAKVVGDLDLAVTPPVFAQNETLNIRINGGPEISVLLTPAATTLNNVIAAINLAAAFLYTEDIAAAVTAKFLKIEEPAGLTPAVGIESTVELGGTAIGTIFGTSTDKYATKHFGNALPINPGDDLYNGTTKLGTVLKLEDYSVGGNAFTNAVIVLDSEVNEPMTYTGWHVYANFLEYGTDERPSPDLYVNATLNYIRIKNDIVRDNTGVPSKLGSFDMYITYTALRLDVTKDNLSGVLAYDDMDVLEAELGPLTPDNPLGLGMYLEMINAPGMEIYGLGVGEISETEPNGTETEYASIAEYMEGQDKYLIVLATQEKPVIDIFAAHANTMSDVDHKNERVLLANLPTPTHKPSTLLGGGEGSNTDTNEITFSEEDVDIEQIMIEAGITDLIDPDQYLDLEIYVVITSDSKKYLVKSVTGNTVTVWGSDLPTGNGANDDGFFSITDLPSMQADGEPCAVYTRGDAITSSTEIMETLAALATEYGSTQVRFIQPEKLVIQIGGIDREVEGFYGCACIAGIKARMSPSQPIDAQQLIGIRAVKGSSDRYSDYQMGLAAGGGVWWIIQDTPGGACTSRNAITTDMSDQKHMWDSVQTALDYEAKYFRALLGTHTGRETLTQSYMNKLATIIKGGSSFLKERRIFDYVRLIDIYQDVNNPVNTLVALENGTLWPALTITVMINV